MSSGGYPSPDPLSIYPLLSISSASPILMYLLSFLLAIVCLCVCTHLSVPDPLLCPLHPYLSLLFPIVLVSGIPAGYFPTRHPSVPSPKLLTPAPPLLFLCKYQNNLLSYPFIVYLNILVIYYFYGTDNGKISIVPKSYERR